MRAVLGERPQLVSLPDSVSSPRRRDVQGLRALAVLTVVAFHAGLPIPGGFLGVDVFFVISGFVITGALSREWTRSDQIHLGRFYLRRFIRLAPGLALVVTVTLGLSIFLMSPLGPQQSTGITGVGSVLMFANYVIARTSGGYFLPAAESNPLLNMWSLSVEEQFYLVFPAVLIAGWTIRRRMRSGRNIALGLIVIIFCASLVLATVGSGLYDQSSELLGFYSPISRAWEFAAGAILAMLLEKPIAVVDERFASAIGFLGLGMLVTAFVAVDSDRGTQSLWTLLPVVGTILVIAAGSHPRSKVNKAFGASPLVTVGNWSYSIYLWHWPLIVLAALVWPSTPGVRIIAAAFALLPAVASYVLLERPVRMMAPGSRSRVLKTVAATMTPPLLVAAILSFGANTGWGVESTQVEQQNQGIHFGWTECMTARTMDGPPASDPDLCRINLNGEGTPITLVGDSNAAQYSEALAGAAEALGSPLRIETAASCPLIDIYRGRRPQTTSESACRNYYETTMSDLIDGPPGVVVIAMAGDYWYLPVVIGSSATNGTAARLPKASYLEEGLRATVLELQSAGQRVLLVRPIYRFDEPPLALSIDGCSLWSMYVADCVTAVPRGEIDPKEELGRTAVTTVANDTGATVVDIASYQCPDEVCGVAYYGLPIYQDTHHITVALSRELSPEFEEALKQALR